jgi:hypothetical protein
MRVPYKPVYFKKATMKFKYIVIHDLSCRFSHLERSKVDSKKVSVSGLRSYNWVFNDEFDIPFHFLCEQIGPDYETVMGTPFSYYCIYDDIPSQFLPSIHIGIAGNYSVMQVPQRAYQQMGYRAISSVMRWFSLPFAHLYLHREISTDKESACPGPMFDKNKLLSNIKPFILMRG